MGAVLGLEQSRGPGDLVRVVGRLVEWLRDSDDDGLKRAFADWVRQMAEGFVPGDAEPASVRTLEGVRMTLVERVAEWLVRCETGSEFLARVDPAAGGANRCGGSGNSRGSSRGDSGED